MYEMKIFIGNKEVEKINDKQKKVMLERAFSTFHKKNVKIDRVK